MPDQVRIFPTGRLDVVTLDEIAIGRFVFRPGWRWSKDVAPISGTRSCQHRHLGYTISGSLGVRMDDGTELVIASGDAYEIPPGHDAWVIGEEPWDSVEFTSAHAFGLSPEDLGERVLATILFSDIVDSTAMLERLGDHEWTRVLREHNVRIRAAIDRFRGREIDAAGDGFLALFDGAAKAVCAAALMDPRSRISAFACASASTRARWRSSAGARAASACTRRRASPRSPAPARCWCPARRATSSTDRACRWSRAASTSSRD
jgi:hypothetical protein